VTYGGYAEAVCAPAAALVRVPRSMGDADAVALVLNYGTAYQLLCRAAEVHPGGSVVVTSAAGGVGTAVLDIARALGVQAVGLASAHKQAVVEQFGAKAVDYRGIDAVYKVRAALGGKGAAAALDGVGGAHLWRSRAMASKRGRIVLFGVAGTVAGGRKRTFGMVPTVAAVLTMPLLGGPRVRTYVSTDEQIKRRDRYVADLGQLFAMTDGRRLQPLIHGEIRLEDVAEAHHEIEAGRVTGKIVITLHEPSPADATS